MSIVTIPDRWGVRGGTAANLASVNETPLVREMIVETDTRYFKIGNGTTPYNSLPYAGIYPAALIPYDNSTSGLAATTVKAGLDELALAISGGGGSGGSPDAADEYYFREDFDRAIVNVASMTISTTEYAPTCYGASSAASFGTPDATAPGVVTITTGTSSSATLRLMPGQIQVVPGSGAVTMSARLRIPTLSTGTETFLVLVGLFDAITGVNNDTTEARYTHSVNGGNWVLRSRVGGVITDTNTAVGPVANTWTTITLVINAAGTSVTLAVDGTVVATNTTNIPAAAMAPVIFFNKSAGTTARTINVDYMEVRKTFASGR